MKEKKIEKCVKYVLIIFLIIQPIFDLKIFYNSISTLIRVAIIILIFIYYYIIDNNKKKYYYLLYPVLVLIYFVFHHINSVNFNSLVPGNFGYSIIKEALYFIKMISPFLLIYSLLKSELSKKSILKILCTIACEIGLIVIVSNIFSFSYGSYSDTYIKANFFAWFNNNTMYTYKDLASKGLFEYANQIGAVLLLILPFSLYRLLKKCSLINFFIVIVNVLSLVLLGTRVSVLGVGIVFIYTVIIFFFYKKVLVKEQIILKSILIILLVFIVYGITLSKNPMFNRIDESKTIAMNQKDVNQIEILEENENVVVNENENVENDIISIIKNNYEKKQIKSEFILQSYPYQYDPEFWMIILEKPLSMRVDYRYLEQAMVERVVSINNNNLDKYFGISNTRIQNIFNIEKDFVVHYYALGMIGIFFVFMPYLAMLTYYLYKSLKAKFECFSVISAVAFTTILFEFAIAYNSGNLLNSLSFTIYFTVLFSLLFKNKIEHVKNTLT